MVTEDITRSHDKGRSMVYLPHGRVSVKKSRSLSGTQFVHLLYTSRAFEWVPLRQVFRECMRHLEPLDDGTSPDGIVFGWRHRPPLSSLVYLPAMVFCDFSVSDLGNGHTTCICGYKRFAAFLDPHTLEEQPYTPTTDRVIHVRTADLQIIHDKYLREALACGLNHIPLHPTQFDEVISEILKAWETVAAILQLLPNEQASGCSFLTQTVLQHLKMGAKQNIGDHRRQQPAIFSHRALSELSFLSEHLFISGLDKASNNACFMCIQHIRRQAVERLQGLDFEAIPRTIDEVIAELASRLDSLFPEVTFGEAGLPYLMTTFKLHKTKYRWITNAAACIFLGPASFVTQILNCLLLEIKEWAKKQADYMKRFFKVDTSFFWIIDSMFKFTMNLPTRIHSLFIADITRCYEMIPLAGEDNLHTALAHMAKLAFSHHQTSSKRKDEAIWVHISTQTGKADSAKWSNKKPGTSAWIEFNLERFLLLQDWLIDSCFIRLGDQVWRQANGIPMGFSCSPLWCNIYFLSYEIQFLQRLAKLDKQWLLKDFKDAFRYIDDLCVLNNEHMLRFLDPMAPRVESNPFWIYPLGIVKIEMELDIVQMDNPGWGLAGHFLNVHLEITDVVTGCYESTKFDKRRELPFEFRQYICLRSNRPVKQSYNISISQTVPILYMANSAALALQEIQRLCFTLEQNGFCLNRLYRILHRFCSEQTFPGIMFPMEQLLVMIDDIISFRSRMARI